jgi:hypothetical protein
MSTYTSIVARYLPSTTCASVIGKVISSSIVPALRSSASSRMVSTGITSSSRKAVVGSSARRFASAKPLARIKKKMNPLISKKTAATT